ncbi:MAG: hybrid sensor histidine kinase/response regulator [Elusimicrobiota bacterium]|jgi:signal transduction histidine kinase
MSETTADILIVDDEQGLRDLLVFELGTQGYRVQTACDGLDAIEKLKHGSYRLAICDLSMPKCDGMKVLETAKALHPEMEVIVATGYGTVETAVKAIKMGASDFVPKPFNIEDMLAAVKRVFEKAPASGPAAGPEACRALRLEAMAQMSAGLARVMNNPLTGILGLSEMLLKNPSLGPKEREDIACICEQGRRCHVIIDELLEFSGGVTLTRRTQDVRPLVDAAVLEMKGDLESAGLRAEVEHSGELSPVCCDGPRLRRAFAQLLANSLHAADPRSSKVLRIKTSQEDGRAVIRFKDEGCGISENRLPHVFDPFYSTRISTEGVGLGLSAAYGIVRKHGGDIRAESQVGEGTLFVVELPLQSV